MWNEERISELCRLVALNLPSRDIAAALGTSKSAILGKAFRLGINVNPDGRNCKPGAAPRERKVYVPPSKPRAGNFTAPLPLFNVKREPTPAGAVAFIDAEPGQCRWFQPDQRGAFGLICARKVHSDKSYCPAHYLRSIDKEFRPAVIARNPSFFCEEIAA